MTALVSVPALARPGSRVVVAGTATHPAGSALPDVPAVASSVLDLAAALRDVARVPAENIGEPMLDPSGPIDLGQALDRATAQATDTLLVYYAGHGLIGDDRELYLATSATGSLVRGLDFTALPYRALLRSLRESQAGTIAVILDCCFSGRASLASGRVPIDAIFEQAPAQGSFLLTSAARDEFALAGPGERHTRFTGALIRLLREGDPAGPRELTLDHVYRYLARALPAGGTPRPHRRSGDGAGEMVLAPNPVYLDGPPVLAGDWRPGDATAPDGGETPEAGETLCPFRGLRPFGPEDARFFFGRDDTVREVTERIAAAVGLLPLIGPSGCGKTSLLRAGVLPGLVTEGQPVVVMTPGGDPLAGLAARADALAASGALLVVDQFEELFTADVTEDERNGFVDRLAELPAVVIALRADFYGRCLRYPALVRALRENQVIVEPMSEDALRLMIRESAAAAGLRLEHGLADTLLREAGPPRHRNRAAVLPLLSHTLQETWLRRSGNLLTLAGYRDTGGIDDAIGRTAEQVYGGMDTDGQSRVRDLLLRMVRLGEDTEDTRRHLPVADLSDADRRVLDALATARLATVDGERAEIAHDALLYAWPRLRDWIEKNRAALLTVNQVDDAARAWERAGRREEYLYRGIRLAAAVDALANAAGLVRPGEGARRFLAASQEQRWAEERAARRRGRRRRATLAVIGALTLVAGAVGVFSVQQHAAAAQHAAVIRSTELAADAAALRSTDPGLAAQLAVAGYRSAHTQQAAAQLYASSGEPVDSMVGSVDNKVLRVTAQADGPLVAANDNVAANVGSDQLRVWDIADPSAPVVQATLTVRKGAALAPRQPLLVAACSGQDALCLWDVGKRGAPTVIARVPGLTSPGRHAKISSMAISPDGTLLALGTMTEGTMLYSIARPAQPRRLAILPDQPSDPGIGLAGVAFSAGGRLLAQTVESGATKLWSLANPERPSLVATMRTGYQDVAFSPNGTLLAAVSDNNAALWNISRPDSPSPIAFDAGAGTFEDLETVAFSPDGRYLVYGGTETGGSGLQTLHLLDVSPAGLADKGYVTAQDFNTGSGTVWMTPAAGDTVLTGGYDGSVRLWHMPDSETANAAGFDDSDWAISGDGRLMAAPVTLADSSATGIWDISGNKPEFDSMIPVSEGLVGFFSDKALLTLDNGNVDLWNVADPRHPVHAASLGTVETSSVTAISPAGAVTFDPALGLVAVLGGDGRLHLWHVTSSLRVTQVGWIPVSDIARDLAGLFSDGQHAVVVTPQGFQWWDIANPARPVHIKDSSLPTANLGSAQGMRSVFVATKELGDICSCATLNVYHLAGGRVTKWTGPSNATGDQLQISADGRLFAAAGGGDNDLTLRNLRDPGNPGFLTTLQTVPDIRGIAFSPDDSRLADWNASTLELWNISDPRSPTLVASVAFQHQDSTGSVTIGTVNSVAFTASSGALAVSVDTSVVFLDTDPAAAASQICSLAGPAITRAQWNVDAPGIPYQAPCPRHETLARLTVRSTIHVRLCASRHASPGSGADHSRAPAASRARARLQPGRCRRLRISEHEGRALNADLSVDDLPVITVEPEELRRAEQPGIGRKTPTPWGEGRVDLRV